MGPSTLITTYYPFNTLETGGVLAQRSKQLQASDDSTTPTPYDRTFLTISAAR